MEDEPHDDLANFVLTICAHLQTADKNLTNDSKRGFGLLEIVADIETRRKKSALAGDPVEPARMERRKRYVLRPYHTQQAYDIAALAPFTHNGKLDNAIRQCRAMERSQPAQIVASQLEALLTLFERDGDSSDVTKQQVESEDVRELVGRLFTASRDLVGERAARAPVNTAQGELPAGENDWLSVTDAANYVIEQFTLDVDVERVADAISKACTRYQQDKPNSIRCKGKGKGKRRVSKAELFEWALKRYGLPEKTNGPFTAPSGSGLDEYEAHVPYDHL